MADEEQGLGSEKGQLRPLQHPALASRKGVDYQAVNIPLPLCRVSPAFSISPGGGFYLWEKFGPWHAALSPLKRAQVSLNLSYNRLILGSQPLELASDQEAPDAGLE